MKLRRKFAGLAIATIMTFTTICLPSDITPGCTVYAAEYTATVTKVTSKTATNSVELYWNVVSSAKSYRVEIKEAEGGKYKKASCKLSKTSDGRIKAAVTGLDPETEYIVRVTPIKTQNGKNVYGKSKTVKFTTMSQGFMDSSIKMPDKYSNSFVYLGPDELDDENIYCFSLDLDENLPDYDKKAEKTFKDYVAYIAKKGYICEYVTDLDAYKNSDGITFVYFFKDNVLTGIISMGYSKSHKINYILFEKKSEIIDKNVKGRVPHPDEYGIKCTDKADHLLVGNVLMYIFECSSSADFDSYIKHLEDDGFKCKAFTDSNGLEMTDVSFKGNHTGTVNYSESEGNCIIIISYKV